MLKESLASVRGWIGQQKNIVKFFSYFIIGNILVAGVFGSLLYFRSIQSLTRETIDANRNMLIQLNKSTDLILTQVDRYLNHLALDPDVANFMRYYQSGDFVNQVRVNNWINNNLMVNTFIDSINIYYFKENKIFSINKGIIDLADFSDRELIEKIQFRPYGDNWLPTRKITGINNTPTEVITVLKPVPLNSFEPVAVVIINIKERYLRNIISSILAQDGLEILVIDNNGYFISSNRRISSFNIGGYQAHLNRAFRENNGYYISKVNKKKVLVSFETSATYGWKYISIIPYKVIVEKTGFIRNYAIIISLPAIILGVIVSLFFSNKIFQPIHLIAGLFNNQSNSSEQNDIFEYIEENINLLVEKSDNIEKTFAEHLPVLRNNFLTGILTGLITDSGEIEEKLRYYGIEIDADSHYIVYLISLDGHPNQTGKAAERQLNILVIYLMDVLNNLPSSNHRKVVVNTKANEIAVIFSLKCNDESLLSSEIERIGAEIQQAVRANANYTFTVAAGSLKKGISRIADSYNEALEALHYKVLIGNQKVIRYEDIQNIKEENFEYPYEKEKELMAAIKRGDFDSVDRLSREIFSFFFNCSESLGDSIYYYYLQLLGSTIRSVLETGINVQSVLGEANLYQELFKCKGNAEIQDWFAYLFKEFTEHIRQRKNTKNKGVIESIVNYIQEHCDQDLSLAALSRRVFLSVPYLSSVFREEYGKSLKQFINEVRIEKAKAYLADPSYQITEVAEKVGYDKVHAFLRLFKESTGMTPGQYRKTIALNKIENTTKVTCNDTYPRR